MVTHCERTLRTDAPFAAVLGAGADTAAHPGGCSGTLGADPCRYAARMPTVMLCPMTCIWAPPKVLALDSILGQSPNARCPCVMADLRGGRWAHAQRQEVFWRQPKNHIPKTHLVTYPQGARCHCSRADLRGGRRARARAGSRPATACPPPGPPPAPAPAAQSATAPTAPRPRPRRGPATPLRFRDLERAWRPLLSDRSSPASAPAAQSATAPTAPRPRPRRGPGAALGFMLGFCNNRARP